VKSGQWTVVRKRDHVNWQAGGVEIIAFSQGLCKNNLCQSGEKLAPSAGLRNRLVHEYDRLEHQMVLEAVRSALGLYPQYVKEIENYITSSSAG